VHLIIAEKNIAAQRIAQILSGPSKMTTSKEGGVNTYQFDGSVSMGLRGHVVEVDFEPGYTNWRSEKHTPRTLIDAGTIKRPTEKKIVNLIHKLAKKADVVTIATDYDTEGELIGKEAYELVRDVNKDVPVRRARFSAITKPEITLAFENPTEIDFNLAAAGESRQVIDLMWGASLTRFISIAARRGGKNILSVGRVQSPTLAMIVEREKEIERFVPEPYRMLHVEAEKDGGIVEARHTHGRFWDEAEARAAEARTVSPLVVTSITEGSKTSRPPAPLDTTSFIVAAARLGFSAANAMRIAEELYMNGFISYPRTDNTVYPASLDLKGVLVILKKSEFARDAEWVLAHMRSEPTRGKKSSTDHPPIHPAGAAKQGQLPDDQWKIYELVVRRFLATLSPDARWKTLKCLFDAGGEEYTATGQRVAEEGFRHVYPYTDAKEYILPHLAEGERLPIERVVLEEKETQPPPRYSQSRLIQQMEELGLGTKSTRHDVIGKLLSRRYVEGTPLRPTLVGMAVTESLGSHASMITKPDMTRTLESHMGEIKKGARTRDDVIAESRGMLHEVFDELEAHKEEIGEEIMERTDEERIVGKCPVCGHDLQIRQTKGMAQFIGCTGYPDCTFNIGLPTAQWGRAIRMDTVCETHGINHVRLIRKGARPWELGCPLCNHISSNLETLCMMPSMTEEFVASLHAHHIYTVYEIANLPQTRIAKTLDISDEMSRKIQAEAADVLELLRRRSELRKFVRSHLPYRRGRTPAKVLRGFFDAGINEIGDLAGKNPADLGPLKLSAEEAALLIDEAQAIMNERVLREFGVPAVSLKKYFKAGIIRPEDFCFLHPAYLSLKTGINVETVQKHAGKVCEGLGVRAPEKVSKKQLEKGRKELLAVPGLGEAALEKLYRAGVVDAGSLLLADPETLEAKTGIAAERVGAFIEALKASYSE
jgi:DNA topoisomerase-1